MAQFSVAVTKNPEVALISFKVVSAVSPINNDVRIFKVIDNVSAVSTFKGVCTVQELLELPTTKSIVNDYRANDISISCAPEEHDVCVSNVLFTISRLSKELDQYSKGVETTGYTVTSSGWL